MSSDSAFVRLLDDIKIYQLIDDMFRDISIYPSRHKKSIELLCMSGISVSTISQKLRYGIIPKLDNKLLLDIAIINSWIYYGDIFGNISRVIER